MDKGGSMAAASTDASDIWSITVTIHQPDLDWGGWTLIVASYLAMAVLTLGVHQRSTRQRSSIALVKSSFWAVIWPIYWLAAIGPLGTLHKLTNFVVDVLALFSRGIGTLRGELLFVYYSVAVLFMPAYQIYLRWD